MTAPSREALAAALVLTEQAVTARDARIAVLEAKVAEQAGVIKRLERQLREADATIQQYAWAEVAS